MTLESKTSAQTMLADGLVRQWPFSFRAWEGQIAVILTAPNGEETDVTELAHIIVYPDNEGGLVTYPASAEVPALASGWRLTVARAMDFLQRTDLVTGSQYRSEIIEDRLDRLTAQDQELLEMVSRAVKVSMAFGEPPPSVDLIYDQVSRIADRAEDAVGRADDAVVRAEDAVDRAEAAADRAGDISELVSSDRNVRGSVIPDHDLPSGSVLTLPVPYFPGRNVLDLRYGGTVCMPLDPNSPGAGAYQYSEVGDDPNVVSDKVIIHFDARAGVVFEAWVVASAVGRNLEQIEVMASSASSYAQEAWSYAESASFSASSAEAHAQAAEASSAASGLFANEAQAARDAAGSHAENAGQSAAAAEASAAASATSAGASAASAVSAGDFAGAAADSASAASASASAAEASAVSAQGSAGAAADSAMGASESATAALGHAQAAASSANDAAASDAAMTARLSSGFDAGLITSGTVDIARLPAAALDRLVEVGTDAARFALTTAQVQTGDTVQVAASGLMYRVIDDSKLNSEAGYREYTAARAAAVAWSGVEGKPTSFVPSAHAGSHAAGGADAVTPESIGALPENGTAAAATKLATARAIGGVSFDGTSDINLPGVNAAGNQNTSGNAGSATKLQTARTISLSGKITGAATSFNGTANISIPVTSVTADSVAWENVTGKPDVSALAAHASSHKTGGSDALTAADIGAPASTLTISTTAPLTGGGNLTGNRTLAVSAASTSAAGVVKLNNTVTSTSATEAATANAVKTAYDRGSAGVTAANAAQTTANTALANAATAQATADAAAGSNTTTRQVSKISTAVAANANFTVPSYTVGSNRLRVWYNGARCYPGTDTTIHQYAEQGSTGAASTTIKFNFALAVGDIVLAEVG